MQIKSITSHIKLHIYCKHGFGLHTRGSFILSLDNLNNIFILLDKDNNFEKEVNQLFNEVSIFIFKTNMYAKHVP